MKNENIIFTKGDLDTAFPGEIYAFPGSPGLYPRFFLGVQFAQKAHFLSHGKEGHFSFFHQYASHSCAPINLTGVLFPAHTSPDTQLVQKLGRFTSKYHYTDSPSLAKPEALEQLRKDFLEAVPLHVPIELKHKLEVAEAFVPLRDPEQVLAWLIDKRLEFIVEIKKRNQAERENARQIALSRVPDQTEAEANTLADRWRLSDTDIEYRKKWARDWKIDIHYNEHPEQEPEAMKFNVKTSPPSWRYIAELAEWLSDSSNSRINERDIFAALIYENCD